MFFKIPNKPPPKGPPSFHFPLIFSLYLMRIYRPVLYDAPQREADIIACGDCGLHFCDSDDIVSRAFHGKTGRALLMGRCMNVYFAEQEEKTLMTGLHIVRDTFCRGCGKLVGWTYDYAQEQQQAYKISKFVLECALISIRSTKE